MKEARVEMVASPEMVEAIVGRKMAGVLCGECGPLTYWRVLRDGGVGVGYGAVACVQCEQVWVRPEKGV